MKRLVKAAAKTGSGTLLSLFFGVISTKIMAVILGPQGIGLFSVLKQVRQTASDLGTVNGQTAIVQGIASHASDREKKDYISTTFWVILFSGAMISTLVMVFAPRIARIVLNSGDPQIVSLIRWLALPIFINIELLFMNGLLNGYRYIGRLASVGVVGAAVTAILAFPVTYLVHRGHLIAFVWMMVGSSLAAGTVSVYFLEREIHITAILAESLAHVRKWAARHFFSFSATMLVASIAGTGALLVIRSMIVHSMGLSGAGIFDVAWTLSMMYVGIVTQSFGTYYMPTLSQVTDNQERVVLIRKLFRLATLLMVPIVVSVIVLKPWVVHLLYSKKFLPSLDIIRWMLIGDYLKVTSWVLAFPLLSYADMKNYLWSELLWSGLFLLGAYVTVTRWKDLEGIGIVFMFLYAGYLMFTYFYCRYKFTFSLTRKMSLHWLGGFLFLLLASIYNWNVTDVRFLSAALWITGGGVISWVAMDQREKMEVGRVARKVLRIGVKG